VIARSLGAAALLAAAAGLLAACAQPPVAAPAPFTAMSANLRYGTAEDGPDAWPLRHERVARALRSAAPDVLGTQETLDFQDEFLRDLLPAHAAIGRGRDADGGGERCTLWINARRFLVEDGGTFWLSPTPEAPGSRGWDAALPRTCTWARLRERASGRTLHVWNLHLDHRGAEARLRSAEALAARLAATPGPHLLLGDLNCGEDSAPLAALRAAGLRDSFRDAWPDAAAVGTFHAFGGGTAGAKIDFVLVDAGLRTLEAAILDQPAPDGRWPSDHHFVSARLAWPP
jgi:endonuclease/exonuclease/phosphatase family metal-dependent hydrolase